MSGVPVEGSLMGRQADILIADEAHKLGPDGGMGLVGGRRAYGAYGAYKAMLAATTLPAGIPIPSQFKRRSQDDALAEYMEARRTEADHERLAKAQAKRDRKAAKRRTKAK